MAWGDVRMLDGNCDISSSFPRAPRIQQDEVTGRIPLGAQHHTFAHGVNLRQEIKSILIEVSKSYSYVERRTLNSLNHTLGVRMPCYLIVGYHGNMLVTIPQQAHKKQVETGATNDPTQSRQFPSQGKRT